MKGTVLTLISGVRNGSIKKGSEKERKRKKERGKKEVLLLLFRNMGMVKSDFLIVDHETRLQVVKSLSLLCQRHLIYRWL